MMRLTRSPRFTSEHQNVTLEFVSVLRLLSVTEMAICAVAFLAFGISCAQAAPAKLSGKSTAQLRAESNPFEKYVRATDRIYVYDRSQFVRYDGPVLSPWNPDSKDGVVERRRLGVISVGSGVKLNIELVTQPMGENYEFISTKTETLVHKFSYFANGAASLLFTGQGVVYEYARIDSLCSGSITRKYEFLDGRFVETPQPMLLINAETEILRDVKLSLSPEKTSSQVAVLPKGSKVTVLTYANPDRFLLKTPLGLTGWITNDRSDSSVSITQCN